jgi:hypothetical protein
MRLTHLESLRRQAFERPGYSLVSYGEIAIPFSVLTLDAIVQTRKPLPAIDEFVLAAAGGGLGGLDEIGAFLGLEHPVVERTVLAQWNLDHLDAPVSGGTRHLVLTPQGQRTLDEHEAIRPERTELFVPFDRLLWRPVRVHPADLLRPRDVRDAQVIEVRAAHARRPSPNDVTVEAINAVIKDLLRTKEINQDLLSIMGISRTERRYQPGILLLYEAHQDKELDLAISIDGRVSKLHTTALNQLGGLKWLDLDFDADANPLQDLRLDPEIVSKLPSEEVETRLQSQVARAEAALERSDLHALADAGDEEGVPPQSESEVIHAELREARTALDALAMRRVPVFEHTSLLWEALRNARRRLLIISPWIKRGVVNAEFLAAIEGRARRNVEITIVYGLEQRGPESQQDDEDAVRALAALAIRNPNFRLRRLGNTHEKILIWDDNWVTTSFNWLSFRGDPTRTLRRESGFLVRDRRLVNQAYEDFLSEIEEN